MGKIEQEKFRTVQYLLSVKIHRRDTAVHNRAIYQELQFSTVITKNYKKGRRLSDASYDIK